MYGSSNVRKPGGLGQVALPSWAVLSLLSYERRWEGDDHSLETATGCLQACGQQKAWLVREEPGHPPGAGSWAVFQVVAADQGVHGLEPRRDGQGLEWPSRV